MEGILTMVDGVGRFLAAIGIASSVIFFAYAGILFMTAGGDPNKQAQARGAFMGVVVGLTILGMSFVIPGVVSEIVIVPSGGVGVQGGVALNDCDGLLRRQLAVQRGANTHYRMNLVVQEVRGRHEACRGDFWDVEITKSREGSKVCGQAAKQGRPVATIGALQFPPGLLQPEALGLRQAVTGTSRDGGNNILVYFGKPTARPWDGSRCWVYFARFDTWRMG